jgi:S-adenosylmethionine-diacylglycerol 3-amino-3-carboxypropyl transferase
VAERILARTRHALTELNPAENPYLTWILTGTHGAALPFALRPENFEPIRANLDRLEWRRQSLEEYLATVPERTVHRFNLSDIFEYMSEENFHALLRRIVQSATPGARLVYWNMLAPRRRPEVMATQLQSLGNKAAELHAQDKAFFYSAVVVEEVV